MASETILDTFVTEYKFRADQSDLRGLDRRIDRVRTNLNSFSQDALKIGAAFAAIGGGILAMLGVGAKAAIDWEDAFTGVRKTVTATEEEFEFLEKRLLQMAANEIPIDVIELARIAELAGQLGIETENIAGFTEIMAKLAETTNLSAEQAATELARFANITQMSQDKFENLGSTIVDLGNNFATTEAEIVSMALRLAGAGEQVDMTEAQILSFAAALSSVGLEPEGGGTAFSRIWVEMQKAVYESSDALEEFGRVSGITAEEFSDLFAQDATEATLVFLEGLNKMSEGGGNVHAVLEELGFDNVRIRDALLRASSASDLFREAVELGNKAWEENIALTHEAELRFKTLKSEIQFLKNNFFQMKVAIGEALSPTLKVLIDQTEEIIKSVTAWIEENEKLVVILAGVAAGLLAFGGVLIGIAVLAAALAVLFTPLGLIILGVVAAISALALAAYFVYSSWDGIVEFFKNIWESIKRDWNTVLDWFKGTGKDESVLSWLWAPVAGLFNWITDAWNLVLDLLGVPREVFSWLGEIEAGIFNWITDAWQAVLDWFKGTGKDESILSWLFEPHAGLFGWIINAWEAVLTWLGVPEEVFSWLGEIEAGIFNWITDAWQAVLDWFKGTGKDESILSWLFEPHAGLFGWIINAWEAVLTWLGVPEEVFSWLGEIEAGIFNWITDAWQAVLDWFKGTGKDESILSWLFEPHAGLFGWIINAWEAVLTWLGVPEEVFSWLGEIEAGIFNWITDAWQAVLDWFKGTGKDESILSWLFEPHAGLFGWIINAWEAVLTWLGVPEEVFSWLGEIEAGIFNWITDAWQAVLDWFKGTGKDESILSWLWMPIAGIFDWITRAWDAMIDGLKDLIPDWFKKFFGIDGEVSVTEQDAATQTAIGNQELFFSLPFAPPVLPPYHPASLTNSNVSKSNSISIDKIEVNVQKGDAEIIAKEIGARLQEQMDNTAENYDSDVLS